MDHDLNDLIDTLMPLCKLHDDFDFNSRTKSEKDRYIQPCNVTPGAALPFPELSYMISDATRSGGIYSPSGAIRNMSPGFCENVDVGSCTKCDGVRVRYTRSRASSAARYSAILRELPNPSPSWSSPENTPTTKTGALEKRPVSRSSLDFGLSAPNFATISSKAAFGSRNLIMPRRSISRVRKYEWTNFRADRSDRF